MTHESQPEHQNLTQRNASPGRHRGRTVATVVAVVGGLSLMAVVLSTTISEAVTFQAFGAGGASAEQGVVYAETEGVTELVVDANAAQVTVEFADVPQATLEVSGDGAGQWFLERQGSVLEAGNSQHAWGGRICFFGCDVSEQRVHLTLPESLNGELSAELSLAAGSLELEGDFVSLDLEESAGEMRVGGSVGSLDATLSAGRMHLDLVDVRTASLEVSAGQITGGLTGVAPRELDIEVMAGGVHLEIPNDTYRVLSEVAAGKFEHELRTEPAASRIIDVQVSAGGVTLTPAR